MRRILTVILVLGSLAVPATVNAQTHTCNGLPATIVGTDGADVLIGTPGDDVIVGLGGNDRIRGKAGNDVICSGSGKDEVWDGPGDDWVQIDGKGTAIAGSGDDHYSAAPTLSYENARRTIRVDQRLLRSVGMGHDTFGDVIDIVGSPFDDILRGNDWDTTIKGGAGNDVIIGHGGHDDLRGQGGDDIIRGKEGDDLIDPGPGDDVVSGGAGLDKLDLARHTAPVTVKALDDTTAEVMGLGRDTFLSAVGDGLRCPNADTSTEFAFASVECGTGDDRIYLHMDAFVETGPGSNWVYAGVADPIAAEIWLQGSGDNRITLDAGRQTVYAQHTTGVNVINLGLDNDTVIGGSGEDTIAPGPGDDTVFGGPGDDVILGGPGNDALAGWDGDDFIVGEAGTDMIEPGLGEDLLVTDRRDVVAYVISPNPIVADLAARTITGNGADSLSYPPYDSRVPLGIIGTPYDDSIRGSGHDTWFDGGEGDDLIEALGGDDVLLGGPGRDILFGGSGDDQLDGGRNGDELRGNQGFDFCWFVEPDVRAGCEAVVLGSNPRWSDVVADLRIRVISVFEDWAD